MQQQGGLILILFNLVSAIIGLIEMVQLVFVVISWLYAFDIVSRRNAFIGSLWEFTRRVTDPMLRPLRRLIPPIAGVDLSVLVLLLILELARTQILPWLYNLLVGGGPFF